MKACFASVPMPICEGGSASTLAAAGGAAPGFGAGARRGLAGGFGGGLRFGAGGAAPAFGGGVARGWGDGFGGVGSLAGGPACGATAPSDGPARTATARS